jgi:DNA-binding NtrC family response regulator
MPGIDGVEVFQKLTRLVPDLPVVMLTGHGNVQQAFETSRNGVFEYLAKPCDMDRLAQVLRNAAGQRGLIALNKNHDEEVRLLLADDELSFVEALVPALERRNIRVTVALSGDEAIDIVAHQTFDVALLDVRMPGLDGLSVLKQLKVTNPVTEVIVLTGHPSMSDAVFGMKQGAFDFLTKPQPVDVLTTRIRAAFRRAQDKRKQQEEKQVQGILERLPE